MSKCKTSAEVGGMGHSVKRKEDARFIRGEGTYVDDIVTPGMVFMHIVRSPYAHAKIKKHDKTVTRERNFKYVFVNLVCQADYC